MPDLDGPFTLTALERCETDIDAVERALTDLDAGSFGRCVACGAPVERDRLVVEPFLRRCARHPAAPVVEAPPTA